MKKLFSAAVCALTTFALSVAQGDQTFFRLNTAWGNFGDPANWGVGTTTAATNPDNLIPGASDWIFAYQSAAQGTYYWDYNFDLSATDTHPSNEYVVRGFSYTDSYNGTGNYNRSTMTLRNGSLTLTDSFTNVGIRVSIQSGAKFTVADTACSRLGYSGLGTFFNVASGAEHYFGGGIHLSAAYWNVYEGATATIKPTFLKFYREACGTVDDLRDRYIRNAGTVNLPNGFLIGAPDSAVNTEYKNNPPLFKFYQDAGTMTVGGDIGTTDTNGGAVYFELAGGTLIANESINFYKTTGRMPANATATIELADGKTIDLSNFTFEDNTTLTITGAGKVIFGKSTPTTLNLDGVTDVKLTEGITFGTVTGYAGVTFSIQEPRNRDDIRITTADEVLRGMLEAVEPDWPNRAWTTEGNTLINAVTDSKIFIWYSNVSPYYPFTDPQYWREGIYTDATVTTTDYPGEHDWIGFVSKTDSFVDSYTQCYDLQGRAFKVRGVTAEGTVAGTVAKGQGYGYRHRKFKNGSIEFTESYFAHRDLVTVENDAKLIIAPTCASDVEWGGAQNEFTIKGALDWQGTISLCCLRILANAGSEVVFAPTSVELNYGARGTGPNSYFDNSGTMSFPNGLSFAGISSSRVQDHDYNFYQRAGEMSVGGSFVGDSHVEGDVFTFDLIGGTLKVTGDSAFTLFDSYGMLTDDSTATIDIAEGKTLDWSKATFAEGTTLNLTGTGKIILGESQPTTMNVQGAVEIAFSTSTTLKTIIGYEAATFSVSADSRNDIVLTIADSDVRAKIAESSAGVGRTWEATDEGLINRVSESKIFIWYLSDSTYRSFFDPQYWREGIYSDTAVTTTDHPGERDWIGFVSKTDGFEASFTQNYDLNGRSVKVKGITSEGTSYGTGAKGQGYGYRYRQFRNGTIEFTQGYFAHRDMVTVEANAKFLIAPTCVSDLQWGGAQNVYTINGELDWQGTISLCSLQLTAAAGSTVNFAPSSIALNDGAGAMYSSFDNSGTMKFPNGLAFTTTSKSHGTAHPYNFYQRAGEMIVGGSFTGDDTVAKDIFTFDLIGGQLTVTGDSAFTLFDSYGMLTEESSATIDIAEGKTLDWSKATFAAGTTLNVTGAGTLVLGESYPETLNLGDGVKLGFATDVNLDGKTITGVEGAEFVLTTVVGSPRAFTVRTTDAALKAKVDAMVLPENWTKTVSDEGITFALPPEVFVWASSQAVRAYDNPAYWSVGAVENVNNNPNQWIPGPQDLLLYGTGAVYKRLYLNMGGQTRQLSGITGDGVNWYEHWMSVENGTLEIVNNFSNYYYLAEIKDGGKFVLGPKSFSRLGYSGAMNNYTVRSGGEVDFLGTIELNNSSTTIDAGGTVLFDPVLFAYDREAYNHESFGNRGTWNSGTINAPHGIAVHGSDNPYSPAVNNPMVYTLQNLGGATINLGGDIKYTGGTGRFRLDVQGGTINVTEDAKLEGLDYANFDNAVAINVADDKAFDLSPATFGAASALTVDGAIKLGVNQPVTLTLAADAKVSFTAPETTLGVINGADGATFAYEGTMVQGQVILRSADDTLLSTVFASLTAPSGWSFVKQSGAIVVLAGEPDPADVICFQSEGEMSLSDDQGSWNTEGGVVPESGDVFVSGANTIAVLDEETVVYDSVSVMRGATLKVSGSVENLPPITLYYGARLLFAEDATVSLANPITCVATEDRLSVVELAEGAVVTAADGYGFKNMHLKNFGWLKFAGEAYIGTAEVGETALFQLTSVGGKFDFSNGGKIVRWVGPKAEGGRVHVVCKVAFKDSQIYASNYAQFSCSVARDNPADEVFDFELDNTTMMLESSRTEIFGGGVKFKCFNGGKIERAPSSTSPGVYAEPRFNVAAQAEFDGEDSRFLHFYNRYKVYFTASDIATPTKEVMTFKNGAYFHVMNFQGSAKDVIGFEDGFWDITELPGYDPAYWNNIGGGKSVPKEDIWQYLVPPFTGFNSIRIGSGKTLGIRSYSVNEFKKSSGEITEDRRWDRKMTLANVPVTGENGSMYVVNATTNQSLEVTLSCGSNTATGDLWAEPSEYGCKLLLASGANWAGTLVASDTIGFTNLADATAPATVTVGNIRFEGRLPIRVWKGDVNTADQLVILGSLAKTKGGFAPVEANGVKFAVGDTFTIGTIPAANLPAKYERAFTSASWRMVAEGDGDTKTLKLVYDPQGAVYYVK